MSAPASSSRPAVEVSEKQLLADLERFEGGIRSLHAGLAGTLTIGIVDTLTHAIWAEMVRSHFRPRCVAWIGPNALDVGPGVPSGDICRHCGR